MNPVQLDVFARIASQALGASSNTPYIIGISGKDAAGKTVFSDALAEYLHSKTDRKIIRISIDDFMNPAEIQSTPSSSLARSAYLYTFDLESFKKFVLEPLQPDGRMAYKTKVFDEATNKADISEDQHSPSDSIVIIDGVLLFKAELSDYFSLKILLDVTDTTAMERGIRRDVSRGKNRTMEEHRAYREVYIECQSIYYHEDQPLKKADIVIDNNDYQKPKILRAFSQNFVD